MATQTRFIVRFSILLQRLVGIVANGASQPGVAILTPALALLQPIRLKPGSLRSTGYRHNHVPERAVTGAAEIHGVFWFQSRRVENSFLSNVIDPLYFGHQHCIDMLFARPVARLAGYSQGQLFLVKLPANRRSGCMA